ncbi:MAG: LLM class flavin-dependent oxidoreductase [Parvibaculaceae bacterium]
MEIGTYTFADVAPGAGPADVAQRMANLIEEMETADRAGLTVFGVGEHHRPDYSASAPAMLLAAGAVRTKSIRLTSAVTVLGSDDPVRVFQSFATLDLLSNGRAELMAGRGSFIESFPLFGYELDDYDALFAEKLDLLLKLRESEHVAWSGKFRPPLNGEGVYPRPLQNPLPLWIAVGGTPQSAVRTGMLGLPMALAIIGGEPARFSPFVDLYREAGERAGRSQNLKLGLNMHGFIAETSAQARDIFFPSYAAVMSRIGRERGWPPVTRAQFDASCGPRGHLLVGSPDEVADKIVAHHKMFGHDRLLVQMALGTMPHEPLLRAYELLGTKVASQVSARLKG